MTAPLILTDLDLAWSALAALIPRPVPPTCLPLGAAVGRRLARDLVTSAPIPAVATAIRDGWAVSAADTAGAGPYGPAPLPAVSWVEAGAPVPACADAVLPAFDVSGAGRHLAAVRDAVAGEGLRAVGEDAPPGRTWRRAGDRLRAVDLPLLAASGVASVSVRRPKVAFLPVGDEIVGDLAREALSPFLSRLIGDEGGETRTLPPVADDPGLIAAGLRAGVRGVDLVLTLGGTGEGRGDRTAAGLAAAGCLTLHGLGARPGSTAGFGAVEGCPVVMLPGSMEDAFAAWLLLARPALLHLLAAAPDPVRRVRLGRKIASAVGMAEITLLRRSGEPDVADPVATGSLPLAAIVQADAVLVVPQFSEGYERGAWVEALDL